MQQALENSGLPSTVGDQDVDASKEANAAAASVSTLRPTSAAMTTSASQPARNMNITKLGTMAVHDSATGLLKRHYIRKVCLM